MSMRRLYLSILSTLTLLLACSCGRSDLEHRNVLVLHAYDSGFAAYQDFGKNVRELFLKAGIDADVQEIFLNSCDYNHIGLDETKAKFKSELDSLGWTPDIIFTDEDRSIDPLFVDHDGFDSYFDIDNTPIVAAGVHFPQWHDYASHANIAVISDPMAFTENIDLAVEMTGRNPVEVELDYYDYDNLIRDELRQAIARPPYLDNTDFHETRLSPDHFQTIFKDYTMVLAISSAYPDSNTRTGDRHTGLSATKGIYTFSGTAAVILLKQDMFGTELLDKTEDPQFTMVNCCFADGRAKTLCGYFTSWETIENDLVDCALRIFGGESPAELGQMEHRKGWYMDYQSMQVLGMRYHRYCHRFQIVGAPFRVRHPILYVFWLLACALLFAAIIAAIFYLVYSRAHRKQDAHYRELRKLEYESDAVLQTSRSRIIHDMTELQTLATHVHPEHDYELARIVKAYGDGDSEFSQNVLLTFDGGKSYHWWEFRMVTVDQSDITLEEEGKGKGKGKGVSYAILVDNDETFIRQRELKKARDIAQEAVKKENFIMNISHEMRTPLNAIVGFSQLLSELGSEIDPQERKEYGQYISDNTESLNTIVNDVLQFSRLEAGRVKMVPEDISLRDFMKDVYEDWMKKSTQDVKHALLGGREDIVIYNDAMRLREAIGQLLSNAFKFTHSGVITMGWNNNIVDDTVAIYVEDTGCGIPEGMQELVFGLFWKADEFVPGIGIGLNIAQSYVEMMGGRVELESKEGVGSRFTMIVPRRVKIIS